MIAEVNAMRANHLRETFGGLFTSQRVSRCHYTHQPQLNRNGISIVVNNYDTPTDTAFNSIQPQFYPQL
ncbi:unnamed protein product [Cyberlindnera jadinii]|uniref:Uncharacterized protein n=1 Tax=Cyberlindnera jadinii (strain ATCC 18201 / CBS 1600 / BCRC 20928 / JCM 3617 / NBRC 0987 / NRRL Y-1542) TaxID=983966 RepID=A0A0H5C7M2_CYBJN|nr:unnamed protein product [Cyberlindnera jadinii]